MNKQKPQYRQGDVLLQRIDSLPKSSPDNGLTKVPRAAGKIVVALGSSNGNPHYFDDKGSYLMRSKEGDQYLVLKGQTIKGCYPIISENRLRVLLDIPKLGKVAFGPGDIAESKDGKARVNGKFSLLKHAEHDVHAIPAGTYNHVPQRGFNRGEIQRVQD